MSSTTHTMRCGSPCGVAQHGDAGLRPQRRGRRATGSASAGARIGISPASRLRAALGLGLAVLGVQQVGRCQLPARRPPCSRASRAAWGWPRGCGPRVGVGTPIGTWSRMLRTPLLALAQRALALALGARPTSAALPARRCARARRLRCAASRPVTISSSAPSMAAPSRPTSANSQACAARRARPGQRPITRRSHCRPAKASGRRVHGRVGAARRSRAGRPAVRGVAFGSLSSRHSSRRPAPSPAGAAQQSSVPQRGEDHAAQRGARSASWSACRGTRLVDHDALWSLRPASGESRRWPPVRPLRARPGSPPRARGIDCALTPERAGVALAAARCSGSRSTGSASARAAAPRAAVARRRRESRRCPSACSRASKAAISARGDALGPAQRAQAAQLRQPGRAGAAEGSRGRAAAESRTGRASPRAHAAARSRRAWTAFGGALGLALERLAQALRRRARHLPRCPDPSAA